MAADGSVEIVVGMNTSQANKQLAKLKANIEKTEKEIEDATKARGEVEQKGIFDAATLDAEKAKLAEMRKELEEIKRASRDKTLSPDVRDELKNDLSNQRIAIQEQQQRVNMLQSEWNKTQNAVDKYDKKIADANAKLDRMTDEAGELQQKINAAERAQSGLSGAFDEASKQVDRFANRLKKLASRVFVFTLITSALRSMRTWLGKSIKTNAEATAAIARLKGALLTLAQPLVEVIIPAFTKFVDLITKIVAAIASVVSFFFGTTAQESAEAAEGLYEEQQALDGVGKAAKKAGKYLANFDEINKIGGEDADGGAEATADKIEPDFTFLDKFSDWLNGLLDSLKEIADVIGLIAAGFALWKIGEAIPGILGTILRTLGGILMTLGGIILYLRGFIDAWNNGLDWDNLLLLLAGLAAAVLGLYAAFGKLAAAIGLIVGGLGLLVLGIKDAFENGVTWQNAIAMVVGLAAAITGLYMAFGRIPAGIAAIVGGIALLVTAFHDAIENGWNLQNTFVAIAGIIATGLGFSFLTGSVIPAIIAGIASLMLALTVATGHGEELINGIKAVIQGFATFFSGIVNGDMAQAVEGLKQIWDGLKIAALSVWEGIKDAFMAGIDWVMQKLGFENWKEIGQNMIDGLFEGLANIGNRISEWGKNFIGGIKNVLGIHSPSTEGEDIGYNMNYGIYNGVDKNKGLVIGAFETMLAEITTLFTKNVDTLTALYVAFLTYFSGEFLSTWRKTWGDLYSSAYLNIHKVMTEIDALNAKLASIERNITITITTIYEEVHGGGSNIAGGSNLPRTVSLPQGVRIGNIPALAQGAVIPANREFLAVLGDQKSGDNYEVPDAKLRQLMREELAAFYGANNKEEFVIMVGEDVLGKLVYKLGKRESKRVGASVVTTG